MATSEIELTVIDPNAARLRIKPPPPSFADLLNLIQIPEDSGLWAGSTEILNDAQYCSLLTSSQQALTLQVHDSLKKFKKHTTEPDSFDRTLQFVKEVILCLEDVATQEKPVLRKELSDSEFMNSPEVLECIQEFIQDRHSSALSPETLHGSALRIVKSSANRKSLAAASSNTLSLLAHARYNLHGQCLRGISAVHSSLQHANFPSADLSGADLRFADLSHANLTKASLCSANLLSIKLDQYLSRPHYTEVCRAVAISPDNSRIFTGFNNRVITVLDYPSLSILRSWREKGESHEIVALSVAPNQQVLVTGGSDGQIRVWSLATYSLLGLCVGHSQTVSSIKISSSSQTLVSGSWDGSIIIWDLRTGECKQRWRAHFDWVTSIAVAAQGNYVVSGSSDKTVKIWGNLAVSRLKFTCEGHSLGVTSVAVAGGDEVVASASWDRTIRIWSASTGLELRCISGHEGEITMICLSLDGTLVVSSAWDRCVKVWEVASGALKTVLWGHPSWVLAVAISNDKQFVVSGGQWNSVKLWKLDY